MQSQEAEEEVVNSSCLLKFPKIIFITMFFIQCQTISKVIYFKIIMILLYNEKTFKTVQINVYLRSECKV